MHKHSQTLGSTGRESPQTAAFGDQHGLEQNNPHGNQFASGTAHRLPPGTGNGIHGGNIDTEHLVGEATLGLQPGQELRYKFKVGKFWVKFLLRVMRREKEGWVKVRRLNTDERYSNM